MQTWERAVDVDLRLARPAEQGKDQRGMRGHGTLLA
jgi:hypothetical protein